MASTTLEPGIYAVLDLDRIAKHLPNDMVGEVSMVVDYALAAVDAGACAVQLRAKSARPGSLHIARIYGALLRKLGARVPVLMNDDVESIAGLTGQLGCGVHVGQQDMAAENARIKLGDNALLGLSTHNQQQVVETASLPVDYIAFGPIHPTTGKVKSDPATGIDALTSAFLSSHHPIVAIGGLTTADIPALRSAGAHAVAVISAWLGSEAAPNDLDAASSAIQELVSAWRADASVDSEPESKET